MKTAQELKDSVKESYSIIAGQSRERNESSCCGSGCCTDDSTAVMAEEYSSLEGYNPEADLGLGCGLPTNFAKIGKGDTVLDLGSGAGNDCFVARAQTGPEGKVIGVDMTPAMIDKARKNAEKLGYDNVEFVLGDIEELPVDSETVDVVVSNCVLNLVPDKAKVFSEILRVLKPGGHFSISDIVLKGELPDKLRNDAEMYAGCISGAIQKDDYLDLIRKNGLRNVAVQKEKSILLPDELLTKYLNEQELEAYKDGSNGIVSITVYAEK